MATESPSLTAAVTPSGKDDPPPLALDKKQSDAGKAAPAAGTANGSKKPPPPLTWASTRAGYKSPGPLDFLVRNGDLRHTHSSKAMEQKLYKVFDNPLEDTKPLFQKKPKGFAMVDRIGYEFHMMPCVLELPALKRPSGLSASADQSNSHPIVPLLRKNVSTNDVSLVMMVCGPLRGWQEKYVLDKPSLYPYQTCAYNLDGQAAAALLMSIKTCRPESMRQLQQRVTGMLWTSAFLFPKEMFSEQTLTYNNLRGMLDTAPNLMAKQPLKVTLLFVQPPPHTIRRELGTLAGCKTEEAQTQWEAQPDVLEINQDWFSNGVSVKGLPQSCLRSTMRHLCVQFLQDYVDTVGGPQPDISSTVIENIVEAILVASESTPQKPAPKSNGPVREKGVPPPAPKPAAKPVAKPVAKSAAPPKPPAETPESQSDSKKRSRYDQRDGSSSDEEDDHLMKKRKNDNADEDDNADEADEAEMNDSDEDSDSGSEDDSEEDEEEDDDDDEKDKDDRVPRGEDDSEEEDGEDQGRKNAAKKKAAAVASVVPGAKRKSSYKGPSSASPAKAPRTMTCVETSEIVGLSLKQAPPKSAPASIMPSVRPGITVGTPSIKGRAPQQQKPAAGKAAPSTQGFVARSARSLAPPARASQQGESARRHPAEAIRVGIANLAKSVFQQARALERDGHLPTSALVEGQYMQKYQAAKNSFNMWVSPPKERDGQSFGQVKATNELITALIDVWGVTVQACAKLGANDSMSRSSDTIAALKLGVDASRVLQHLLPKFEAHERSFQELVAETQRSAMSIGKNGDGLGAQNPQNGAH
ncbi:MAG: hypothetical protein ACKVI4_15065 [Actinomycetales bacterium]